MGYTSSAVFKEISQYLAQHVMNTSCSTVSTTDQSDASTQTCRQPIGSELDADLLRHDAYTHIKAKPYCPGSMVFN